MIRIGVRELRQHASRYLARVKAGETVEVGERGRLVAKLVPPDPGEAARDVLIASGQVSPARAPFLVPSRRAVGKGRRLPSVVLDELRSDRFK